MIRILAILSLVLAESASVSADEARPKGSAPLFFIVTSVNKDGIVIERAPVATKEVSPKGEEYRAMFKEFVATEPKGRKLTSEEIVKRVKRGSVVLVNDDDGLVDPAYLAIVKDDTVILSGVLPPKRGKPIKPE